MMVFKLNLLEGIQELGMGLSRPGGNHTAAHHPGNLPVLIADRQSQTAYQNLHQGERA
jgi:hypothetical protein